MKQRTQPVTDSDAEASLDALAAVLAALPSAADVRAFLEDLSRIIGDFDRIQSSTSSGKGHRSVSQQLHRERILDVADLAAMPKGRAVVLASGNRPTLIRTQPWMTGPHADQVRASIAAHDPQSHVTIQQAQRELHDVQAGPATQEMR